MSGVTQALVGGFGYKPPYSLAFVNSYTSAADTSSYTFSNVDFGAAGATREVFVVIVATTTTPRSVSSVTIGGVTATRATSVPSASNTTSQSIAFATVPTGTSGAVAITFSGACSACYIAIYRVENRPNIGSNHSDYDTAGSTSRTSYTLSSVTIPANGFGLGTLIISGTGAGATSSPYVIAGPLSVGSNYRTSLNNSRIGLTSVTPSNVVSWTTSSNWRHTLWAYS